jgi:hypothetical protein
LFKSNRPSIYFSIIFEDNVKSRENLGNLLKTKLIFYNNFIVLRTNVRGECSMPQNLVTLCSAQPLHTPDRAHQSLTYFTLCTIGVTNVQVLTFLCYTCQKMPLQSVFLIHSVPYSKPSFLNVSVLHHNVFTKAVYSQTSKAIHSRLKPGIR